jgi:hypothetical protein
MAVNCMAIAIYGMADSPSANLEYKLLTPKRPISPTQGGGRPKIPHLRSIFVKKVDLTPPLPLPALSGQEMSIYGYIT